VSVRSNDLACVTSTRMFPRSLVTLQPADDIVPPIQAYPGPEVANMRFPNCIRGFPLIAKEAAMTEQTQKTQAVLRIRTTDSR